MQEYYYTIHEEIHSNGVKYIPMFKQGVHGKWRSWQEDGRVLWRMTYDTAYLALHRMLGNNDALLSLRFIPNAVPPTHV